jgi:hypothetical protein
VGLPHSRRGPQGSVADQHGYRPSEWLARPAISSWAVITAGLSPLLLTAGWLLAGSAQPPS